MQCQNKTEGGGLIAFLLPVGFCFALAFNAAADGWSQWAQVSGARAISAQLATDGTNMFYSTVLDGVYRAKLTDKNFSLMPMTGFPIWDANTNTNGFGVWNLAVTPSGQLLISGTPVSVTFSNGSISGINALSAATTNAIPVFYWWDESNQLWHASSVTNKSYPYTLSTGNFTFAPDGAVWTCTGFQPYAYRSTNDGKSFTAFDINASVPTNYLPMPNGQTTFGKVFSILATPRNDILIGTETGGFLRSTNNGLKWTSLDPNFTNTNSTNPLGRVGNALVAGLDKFGSVLLKGFPFSPPYASISNWTGVTLIGWRPADGSFFNAAHGIPATFVPPRVVTMPSGDSFTYMGQNFLLQGGVYRSPEGTNWTQFNQGSGLDFPFAPGLTNAIGQGNIITTLGQKVFIGVGGANIYAYDDTPPPITNRPPVALPQNVNFWENSPTNLTLTGRDADGDALNYSLVIFPANGILSGTPPDLIYTPSNNFTGLDFLTFAVDDGIATSATANINIYVNPPTNTLSTVTMTSPTDGKIFVAPANITVTVAASDPGGISSVNFYLNGSTNEIGIGAAHSAPYTVFTNLPVGDYTFSARVIASHGARTWSAPVRVTVLPEIPRLTIQPMNVTNVAVTWPIDLAGFFVESASDLAGPWTLSPVPPYLGETNQTATIPMADQQFFRLMRPH